MAAYSKNTFSNFRSIDLQNTKQLFSTLNILKMLKCEFVYMYLLCSRGIRASPSLNRSDHQAEERRGRDGAVLWLDAGKPHRPQDLRLLQTQPRQTDEGVTAIKILTNSLFFREYIKKYNNVIHLLLNNKN